MQVCDFVVRSIPYPNAAACVGILVGRLDSSGQRSGQPKGGDG